MQRMGLLLQDEYAAPDLPTSEPRSGIEAPRPSVAAVSKAALPHSPNRRRYTTNAAVPANTHGKPATHRVLFVSRAGAAGGYCPRMIDITAIRERYAALSQHLDERA